MSQTLNVSLEFISTSAKTALPAGILAVVQKMRDVVERSGQPNPDLAVELASVITKHTRLRMEVVYDHFAFGPYIYLPNFAGHSGTSARSTFGVTDVPAELIGNRKLSTVDLENVRVTGFFEKIPFKIGFPSSWLDSKSVFTNEEITATILHEVGHAFFTLATLGEYVWLNYFLTDGADILLGKKPNKYKVELLDREYLEKHSKNPRYVEKLKQHPTEANARRAILADIGWIQRDHLSKVMGLGAIKRDEQLADVFATRLGFGRALVTALDKAIGWDRYYMSTSTHLALEACKLGVMTVGAVVATPMFLAVTALILLGEALGGWNVYDNTMERYLKVKRDLVTQLKHRDLNAGRRKRLLDDIKAIDDITKKMTAHREAFTLVAHAIFPTRRREHHQLKMEEQLEALLNNDLFTVAAQLTRSA